MAEAETGNRPSLTRARMFRNGLMMALLAYCPIRLKNFAALEIGRRVFVGLDGVLVDSAYRWRNEGKETRRTAGTPRNSNHQLSAI